MHQAPEKKYGPSSKGENGGIKTDKYILKIKFTKPIKEITDN